MAKTDPKMPRALKAVVAFHGHVCPGLLIGYRAGKAALDRLGVRRAQDEELVAIVENDSCSVDAIQCLTGCSFGKGNFFFRDHGKQVFTLARRPSGKGVRIALRADATPRKGRSARMKELLKRSDEDLFQIADVTVPLPKEAEIHRSMVCDGCGEQVMETRTRRIGRKCFCIPCARGRKRRAR